jgi:ADP-ribose pyrophosphatase YjhB (NUDIX family)
MNYINIKHNNEINDTDTDINEKIIIPKKNYYCSNCNKKGHTFKKCLDPIISNGIIGIYIENFEKKLILQLENYIIANLKIFSNKKFNEYSWLDTLHKINNKELNNNIKFLMIQRKNSLGYLEFMRGRYNTNEDDSIIHLFEQMIPDEIYSILHEEFDILWNNLWDKNNIRNKNHYKEYTSSKQKFIFLKLNKLDLLNSLKPLYLFNEWGFPKGRRESYESDLVCAIREFEEETAYIENQYTILEQCKVIKENLKGTNNINYAHNYFLAILNEKNEYYDKTNREVGDIKIMNLNECIDSIRPYHNNKIKIIKHVYNIINKFLEEYDIYK